MLLACLNICIRLPPNLFESASSTELSLWMDKAYGGTQWTKKLQLQKSVIFAVSTKNCALFGYLNSILSISVWLVAPHWFQNLTTWRCNFNFAASTLQLQFCNFNFATSTLQLQFCNFNFATSTLQLQLCNFIRTSPFMRHCQTISIEVANLVIFWGSWNSYKSYD